MAESFSFVLLFVMPVIVGYVAYRIITYDPELWKKYIDSMGDDIF